jgi:hypothetical protein
VAPERRWCGAARGPLLAASLIAGALAAPAVHAQAAARVSGAGDVVTIVDNGATHRIRLPATVKVDMDTVEVLDAQRIGSITYMLLSVNGPSKRTGFGIGQCGAGFETGIVWLQLLAWRIQRSQSQLVESCWRNSMITETMQVTDDAISLTYMNLDAINVAPTQTSTELAANAKTFVLRYDRAKPMNGFVVRPAPVAK